MTLAELSEPEDEKTDFAVSVATTARLHFGFFDPSGRSLRPFGSFGLSLDQPFTRLLLAHDQEDRFSGTESARAERYLKTMAKTHQVEGTYRLEIAEAIPSHAGLGSGTQLALAVGTAFSALENLNLTTQDIAATLGRGARSGIGIATFDKGGAVLDSGPRDGALPELVARVPFPDAWRTLLIFDHDEKGLQGADEVAAFEASPTYSEEERSALEERVVRSALPALETADFATFCAEVGHMQERMGAYFAPRQGGIYTSPRVAAVLEALRAAGVAGLGQSSWGPTGFAFAASETEANALLDIANKANPDKSLHLVIARGRNEGAEITRTPL